MKSGITTNCGENTNNKSVTSMVLKKTLGLSLILVGCLLTIWTPFNLIYYEKLKMRPGLPFFEWWRNLEYEININAYVFNITNSEEFLNGTDDKLNFKEIGPFKNREMTEFSNFVFDDDKLSYRMNRTYEFYPSDDGMPHQNYSIIVPNLALLAMSSYLHDASFFKRYGFNALVEQLDTKPFLKATVEQFFWNMSDPLLILGHVFIPNLVPSDNMGVLHLAVRNDVNDFTVNIGPNNEKEFFKIVALNGNERMMKWKNLMCDGLHGGSDGIYYRQSVLKSDVLSLYRRQICRSVPFIFSSEESYYGLKLYKFEPIEDYVLEIGAYSEGCTSNLNYPRLPNGILDTAPCFDNFPIGISKKYFKGVDPKHYNKLSGMEPDKEVDIFLLVEPISGIPFDMKIRVQVNVVMHNVKGISRVNRLLNTPIPILGVEIVIVKTVWYIVCLIYFWVVILPVLQYVLIFLLIAGGIYKLFGEKFKRKPKDPSNSEQP